MEKPRIYVDFNELLESNLVLISVGDTKRASTGENILFHVGMKVDVYMDDTDLNGKRDYLIASGIVEENNSTGWAKHVKWCCRIDENGIRHESELGH